MAVSQATLRVLAQVSDELDKEGYETEANVIDQVTQTIVDELLEQEGNSGQRTIQAEMSGKANKALQSLDRALTSFLGKNLDSRGENRRNVNKCVDLAEDLKDSVREVLGSNGNSGA